MVDVLERYLEPAPGTAFLMKWVGGLIKAAVKSFVTARVPVISRVRRVKPTAGSSSKGAIPPTPLPFHSPC